MNRSPVMKHRVAILLFVLSAAAGLAQNPDALLASLTKPATYVNDYAGVFSATNKVLLESYLQEVQSKTTAEIAVVALKSLEGGEINDFANRLFQKWGIGKKGKDNGVLLVAAIEDRKVRIEVGYGLEGAIPDAKAGRLLDESVIPFFKEGRYGDGLTEGARAISAIVLQEVGATLTNALAAAVPAVPAAQAGGNPLAVMVFFLIFGGFIGFMVFAAKKGWVKSGRSSGGGWSSHSSGGGGGGGFGGGSSGGGGASRGW